MPVIINGREVFNNTDINNPDIDGGTIDGATIATSNITVGTGKTLDVSAGTLTLADDQISGDKVEGGTINAVTINTVTTPAITAPSSSLVIKPTTDATTAVQVADKDGNAILTIDSTNDKVIIPSGKTLDVSSGSSLLGTPTSGDLKNCLTRFYEESVTLNGQDGVTVTHSKGNTNYRVDVTVTTSDVLGLVGSISVVKASNTCVVYNSGIAGHSADVRIYTTA